MGCWGLAFCGGLAGPGGLGGWGPDQELEGRATMQPSPPQTAWQPHLLSVYLLWGWFRFPVTLQPLQAYSLDIFCLLSHHLMSL